MPFSEKAKVLKVKGNFTLQELAVVANVSESTMSRYINGQVAPPADIAAKVLAHMGYVDEIEEIENRILADKEDKDMITVIETIERLYGERIKEFNARIEELTAHLNYERNQKRLIFLIMLAALAFIIIFMAVDILNGNVGWFRH